MAHYTIELPGGILLKVSQGKVFKKMIGLTKHWPWVKFKGEERTGYVVAVDAGNAVAQQYCLVKTSEGKWPSLPGNDAIASVKIQGRWQPVADDQFTLVIKNAIDAYENK